MLPQKQHKHPTSGHNKQVEPTPIIDSTTLLSDITQPVLYRAPSTSWRAHALASTQKHAAHCTLHTWSGLAVHTNFLQSKSDATARTGVSIVQLTCLNLRRTEKKHRQHQRRVIATLVWTLLVLTHALPSPGSNWCINRSTVVQYTMQRSTPDYILSMGRRTNLRKNPQLTYMYTCLL